MQQLLEDTDPFHTLCDVSLYIYIYIYICVCVCAPTYTYIYMYVLKTVKCTLVQALRLCTGRTAHKGSRGIDLLFLDHDTRRGEGPASRSGRSLSQERFGTHCTGGWVGPRVGLDKCEKSQPHWGLIPDRSARSQPLYRLRYPAHIYMCVCVYIFIYVHT